MNKQKKRIAAALAIVICLMVAGCGENKKPDDISAEAYEKATTTIDAIDLYLDEKSDLDKTLDSLCEIEMDISFDEEYMLSLERNENDELIDKTLEFPRDCAINADIFDIKNTASSMRFAEGENKQRVLEQIRDLRDGLAKKANYKD